MDKKNFHETPARDAAMLTNLGEHFDEIFNEIPFLTSFTFKYGATWDPHIPTAHFKLLPVYDGTASVPPAATRVIEQMVLDALLETGAIVREQAEEEGSQYVSKNAALKTLLQNTVFTPGARVAAPAVDPALATAMAASKKLAM